MLSHHFENTIDWNWNTFYKYFLQKVKLFLRNKENKKIYIVFDWSDSSQFLVLLEKELNKCELKRVCFLGHYREGYNWKGKNNNCPPIGGLLSLILMNSISITKKEKCWKNFEKVFCEQAYLIYEMVLF